MNINFKKVGLGISGLAVAFGAASALPYSVFADNATKCVDLAVDAMTDADATSVCVDTAEKLNAAVGYEKFSKIVLTNDIEINNVLDVSHDLEINLAGTTLSSTDGTPVFSVTDGATLTIDDTNNGKIVSGEYIARVNASNFVLNNGTLTATKPRAYGVFPSWGGSATINGGSITADYAAFAGNNTTGDMNFYVNGGTLTSANYPAIYMPGQVYLKMTGGTLNGGIVARLGQITVSGGTINNSRTASFEGDGLSANYSSMPSMTESIALISGTYNSDNGDFGNKLTFTMTGGTINDGIKLYDLGRNGEKYAQEVDVKITGGVVSSYTTGFTNETIGFTVKNGYAAGSNYAAGRINTGITGGTFNVAPDSEYIPDGYDVYKADGVYKVDAEAEDELPFNVFVKKGDTYTFDLSELAKTYGTFIVGDKEIAAKDFTFNGSVVGESVIEFTLNAIKNSDAQFTTIYTYVEDNEDAAVHTEVDSEPMSEEALDDEVVSAFEEIANGDKVAGYYDVQVLLKDETGSQLAVLDETTSGVKVTLDFPEDLEGVKEGYTREYYMIRIHNDEPAILEVTDNGDGTFSFYSDKFSVFALAYEDTAIQIATTPDTGVFTAESGANATGSAMIAVIAAVVVMAGTAIRLTKR